MLQTTTSLSLKEMLEGIMKHQLALLRDLLASLCQEQQFLNVDNQSALHKLHEDRLQLLETFEQLYLSFERVAHELICLDKEENDHEEKGHTLMESIDLLRTHLQNGDVELLLLCEQIMRILEEVERKATEIYNILEHISPTQAAFNAHFKKIKPQGRQSIQISLMEPESQTISTENTN